VALRAAGVPAYRSIERAVGTLARLAAAGEAVPDGIPPLPPAAPPLTTVGYAEARALLAEDGVPFVEAVTVTSAEDAVAAAAPLGYPVVVKALGMLHKSDAGGVVLGVPDADALRAVVADLRVRLAPPALSVERMVPVAEGVELLVGARRDARFGPIALAGIGGVHAETMRDVAVALAPLDAARAERLLRSLRSAPLLAGARGRSPVDVHAAARALAALSEVAAAHPEIAEIEVNPLLALPDGALGLDARVVLQGGAPG
jgi:acetate---CoA ligase (ADP-forming)